MKQKIKKRLVMTYVAAIMVISLFFAYVTKVSASSSGSVTYGTWSGTHSISNQTYSISGSLNINRSSWGLSIKGRVEGVGTSSIHGIVGTYNSGNVGNNGNNLTASGSIGNLPYTANGSAGTAYCISNSGSETLVSTLTDP